MFSPDVAEKLILLLRQLAPPQNYNEAFIIAKVWKEVEDKIAPLPVIDLDILNTQPEMDTEAVEAVRTSSVFPVPTKE